MEVVPVTLEGKYVRLVPMSFQHEELLNKAADDGELWKSTVTFVPTRDKMSAYIKAALDGYAHGRELSFVIVKKAQDNIAGQAGTHARTEELVGTTRFYEIEPNDRRVAIGYTWLSASAQRTAVNTEAKLLLLTHAFETWNCHRVELITDVLNEQSRTAILHLGAKQEGILRSHMVMPNGRVRDSVIFSIIRAEWPDVKERLRRRLCEGKS